ARRAGAQHAGLRAGLALGLRRSRAARAPARTPGSEHDVLGGTPMNAHEVHPLRLYLMRLLYLLNFLFLGVQVWPELFHHAGPWDPVKGVAFSFWAALSTLCALGIRHPLRMTPVLLMQFLYKLIWLVAIAWPQWSTLQSRELTHTMV